MAFSLVRSRFARCRDAPRHLERCKRQSLVVNQRERMWSAIAAMASMTMRGASSGTQWLLSGAST